MRSIRVTMGVLLFAAALAGCGGGGGGGGSSGGGGGGGGPSANALAFSPGTLTANVQSGSSATISVRAQASDPSQFSGVIYAYVVDSQKVLTGTVSLAPVDNTTASVTVYTSPSLSAGKYQGTFQVQLCRDSSCASQIPGSPVALPYDFTIAAGPLNVAATTSPTATVNRGGQSTRQVTITVRGGGESWSASTSTSWLQVNGGSGKGNGSFTVSFLTPAVAQGSHSGEVVVTSSDGQKAPVSFTLQVLAPEFTLTSGVPSFAAINGAPIAAQALSFAINNGVPTSWQAAVSANWMVATPMSGITPSVVTLQPNPSIGNLASGAYSANIVLSSDGIASKSVTSKLDLTSASLSAPTTTLTLGGPKGRDLVSEQSTVVSLNTGANSWPFMLSGLPSWLKSSTASGMVGGAGTSVAVAPVAGVVTPGSRSTTINMTATVNGDRATLPFTVNLNADQRRLLPSEWGVGLASSPGGTVLSRTLKVKDNFGGSLAWTASSDASWLSVTGSGTTGSGGGLTLSADPSALPANALSYANVTITSSSNGVSPATVRVALWKGTSSLASVQVLAGSNANIVADKIRPYVYLNDGGAGIDVYNVYTAAKIATIPIAGARLGQMGVSGDGSRLYALDTAGKTLVAVDLGSQTKVSAWPVSAYVDGWTSVLPIRPNGVEVILLSVGSSVYADGRPLTGSVGFTHLVTASADGLRVFSQNEVSGPMDTYAFDVDYSEMSGGVLMSSRRMQGRTDVPSRDIAVSPDGTRLYMGGSSSSACAIVDPSTMNYIGGFATHPDLAVNNIKVASDGRVACLGTIYQDFKYTNQLEVYAVNGSLLKTISFVSSYGSAGARNSRMAISPDGFVAVVLTSDPSIAFMPIGP